MFDSKFKADFLAVFKNKTFITQKNIFLNLYKFDISSIALFVIGLIRTTIAFFDLNILCLTQDLKLIFLVVFKNKTFITQKTIFLNLYKFVISSIALLVIGL